MPSLRVACNARCGTDACAAQALASSCMEVQPCDSNDGITSEPVLWMRRRTSERRPSTCRESLPILWSSSSDCNGRSCSKPRGIQGPAEWFDLARRPRATQRSRRWRRVRSGRAGRAFFRRRQVASRARDRWFSDDESYAWLRGVSQYQRLQAVDHQHHLRVGAVFGWVAGACCLTSIVRSVRLFIPEIAAHHRMLKTTNRDSARDAHPCDRAVDAVGCAGSGGWDLVVGHHVHPAVLAKRMSHHRYPAAAAADGREGWSSQGCCACRCLLRLFLQRGRGPALAHEQGLDKLDVGPRHPDCVVFATSRFCGPETGV